ncbi:ubiquinone anaerobic biosynthesis protein UbiV [Rhodovibrionaceae bacterium A322]
MSPDPELTLGPVLFNWSSEQLRDFYFQIADETDVSRVYLGEVVCSKRLPFRQEFLPVVIERLTAAGKQVVLSSLALVTNKSERRALADLCTQDDHEVEVNDLTAQYHLNGKRHVLGPYLNIYNEDCLASLVKRGAYRLVIPPELPADKLAGIIQAKPECEIEVQVFGRLPLALSARCYHARIHGLTKDSCRFVCEKDPDGLLVKTMTDQDFLAVNGIQTLSDKYQNLMPDLPVLNALGVRAFRLSPHSRNMPEVIQVFADLMAGRYAAEEAEAKITAFYPEAVYANGYMHGLPGMERVQGAI